MTAAILASVLTVAGGAARSAAGEPASTTGAATTTTATLVTTTTLPTGATAGSTTTAESTSTSAEGGLAAGATSTTQAGLPPGQSISISPESGPPGTVVTLEVAGCMIGGWPANWTFVNVSPGTSMLITDFGEVAADGSYSVRFAIPDLPPGRTGISFACGVDDAVAGPPGVDFTVTEGPLSGVGGRVTAWPSSGPAGTVVTMRASGCALDGQPATFNRLTLVQDLSKRVQEGFGVADATGAFTGTFVVPDWKAGFVGIEVLCAVGDVALPLERYDATSATKVGFEITAASPPTPVVVRPDYTG